MSSVLVNILLISNLKIFDKLNFKNLFLTFYTYLRIIQIKRVWYPVTISFQSLKVPVEESLEKLQKLGGTTNQWRMYINNTGNCQSPAPAADKYEEISLSLVLPGPLRR